MNADELDDRESSGLQLRRISTETFVRPPFAKNVWRDSHECANVAPRKSRRRRKWEPSRK